MHNQDHCGTYVFIAVLFQTHPGLLCAVLLMLFCQWQSPATTMGPCRCNIGRMTLLW